MKKSNNYSLIAFLLFLVPLSILGSWLLFQFIIGDTIKEGLDIWKSIMPDFLLKEGNMFKINLFLSWGAFGLGLYGFNSRQRYVKQYKVLSVITVILGASFGLLCLLVFIGS